jgi:cobalt-zinc-cadmium efflux system membrane fusion protein
MKINEIKRQKRWIPIGIAVALAACLLGGFSAWRGSSLSPEETALAEQDEHAEESSAQTIQFDEESAKLAGIKLTEAKLGQLATGIAFNGQIAANPNAVAQVASLVPGRVTQLMVSQGDKVKAGQTLAVIESRAIGEAQSAFAQAAARYQNAKTHLSVVTKQAQAGVFSRGPVEAARKTDVDATGNVRESETAMQQAHIALENVERQAKAGAFSSPALEAAKTAQHSAKQALAAANAELGRSQNQLESAKAELARRQQLAAAGTYGQKPVEEARRAHSTAQAQLSAARSEHATAHANSQRTKVLLAEGLISQREAENTNLVYEQAQARLEAAQSEVTAAQQNWDREKKITATNVAGTAEVNAAKSQLTDAEAATKTRRAETQRAQDALKLADASLKREQVIYAQNIANRREVSTARTNLEQAKTALAKARQQKVLSAAALAREQRIAKQNLNDISQLQSAEAEYRAAQADLKSARTTLSLLKSSPSGKASIPVRAPISGVVSERKITLGEIITAEKELMTIINLDNVALEAAIYEKDIAAIRIGTPVTIQVDALKGHTFTGRITFLSSTLDPETRTLTARALIDNPGALRPGMFARGEISTATGRSAITVPTDAVQSMDGKNMVFAATDKAYAFTSREVIIGAKAKGFIEIKSGLQPGEKIVSKGAFVVKAQAMKDELAED